MPVSNPNMFNDLGTNWGMMDTGAAALPQLNSINMTQPSGNTWGGMLGTQNADGTTTQGWGGMALGAAQSIGNIFMGMKQYGMAKDQLAQSKKQFDLNFGAQKKTTNAALEDRQAARVASNPGAYQSVGEYMKKNGI